MVLPRRTRLQGMKACVAVARKPSVNPRTTMKLQVVKKGQRLAKRAAFSHPRSPAERQRRRVSSLKKQAAELYSRAKQRRAVCKNNRATSKSQNKKQPKRARKDAEASRLLRDVKKRRPAIPAPGNTESKRETMKKPCAQPKAARGQSMKASNKSRKITRRMLPKQSVEDPRLRHVRECRGLVIIFPLS
eukprot:TRINITY_DN44420_c0_g1_i1.p1 TRINITY_DN44420_c0_g1~~TRINITY_DN44420_c0_g1_i1.p1  ORF type:complete len:189 (+),score=24.48 TRINITY_DN44420_c0_g1_i1:63-629(+)